MKYRLLLVFGIAALVFLSGCCPQKPDYKIQFFESDGSPMSGLEVEFAPNRGNWNNRDFSGSLKFMTDSEGIIYLKQSDVEYLLAGFLSGGEEGPANSKLTYNGESIANSIYLYDTYWYEEDAATRPLEKIEIGCYQCDVENKEISKGETAKVTIEDIIYALPLPEPNEIFEIPGGECPIPEEAIEKEFALPEGCSLLAEPKEEWFFEYDIVCDNNLLVDFNCVNIEWDENYETYEMYGAGKLVKTSFTDKTLIECQVDYYMFEFEPIRVFDWHPGPLISSFYVGYDDSTKETVRITDRNALFEFLAPADSAEKVWGGLRLATADAIYCYFKSNGYYPWPPEGYVYDQEVWTFEEFIVPKEEIGVSSVEAVSDGFKVHLLMERQGCQCYINYYELWFELSTDGKITNESSRYVYSAWEGCIC